VNILRRLIRVDIIEDLPDSIGKRKDIFRYVLVELPAVMLYVAFECRAYVNK
jgi:hypothetical protein